MFSACNQSSILYFDPDSQIKKLLKKWSYTLQVSFAIDYNTKRLRSTVFLDDFQAVNCGCTFIQIWKSTSLASWFIQIWPHSEGWMPTSFFRVLPARRVHVPSHVVHICWHNFKASDPFLIHQQAWCLAKQRPNMQYAGFVTAQVKLINVYES